MQVCDILITYHSIGLIDVPVLVLSSASIAVFSFLWVCNKLQYTDPILYRHEVLHTVYSIQNASQPLNKFRKLQLLLSKRRPEHMGQDECIDLTLYIEGVSQPSISHCWMIHLGLFLTAPWLHPLRGHMSIDSLGVSNVLDHHFTKMQVILSKSKLQQFKIANLHIHKVDLMYIHWLQTIVTHASLFPQLPP